MAQDALSHVDISGELHMVDVSAKEAARRVARARCIVVTQRAILDHDGTAPGVLQDSRLAGIQAAKQTATLIPLCHPLGLDDVQVNVAAHPRGYEVLTEVTTIARTGVEMEALTACAYCALSLLEALRTRGEGARITELAVLSKSGGKSDWGSEVPIQP